ncbi:phosphatidylinositol 4,5-bisphosphate 3-kinase catalytic subunit delta isoform [Agrilus planipennis]|uniref:phosphatidylinositol 3-kinase n=1 Tax=Agrilus planipennis TaxID=224129 RepID=A0A1W4WFE0_AGRPL|nr:phosphatidylinositol 4,5-bisphosphate 3-kinase catalytic subunit delta isoform [Agrilus planipennis]
MVPIPKEFTYDFWLTGPTDFTVVTCLMPNGVCILLDVSHNATLAEIKEELWEEAAKYPLYGMLHDMSVYVFLYVNSMSELERITDENRRLCDVRPTGATLKLTECHADKAEHQLNIQISHLIGKRLQEFDALSSAEINDFRFKMRKLGDEIAYERSKLSWQERLHYQFPPRLAQGNVNCDRPIVLISKFENIDTSFTFSVPGTTTPSKLLETILNKKGNILNIREKPCDYILKVCGRDEFLVGDYDLIQFQYIQDALNRDITPVLVTIPIDSVPVQLDINNVSLDNFEKKNRPSFSTNTLRNKKGKSTSWKIVENLRLTICTVSGLNCDTKRNVEIGIQVGLFHGGKSLCEPIRTPENTVNERCECVFDHTLTFNIQVCNIPKNGKLCFVVYEASKSAKGGKTKKIKESSKEPFSNPIAWANTTVYDFKNQLKTGAMTLYMWTYAEDTLNEDAFHPLGTVVSNPNTKYATALTLIFDSYGQEQTITFPSLDILRKHANENILDSEDATLNISRVEIQYLQKTVLENDSLYETHDQDRKKIWSLRRYWMINHPDILPKLLLCIDWDDKKVFCEVYALLKDWPHLPVEKALELLDYAYSDQEVRRFAVKCLSNLSDEDLLLYLLQLVQALKHELYLDCDLVNFLLKRALNNQKIGHYLFWLLRSEMQMPSVSVRFGLILEAYCRGSQEHLTALGKQLECLERLKKCSESVRTRKDKDKARAALIEDLQQPHCIEALHNIRNPLDPSFRCGKIRIEKCKVMDSKMKPLWVVFENSDTFGDDIYFIFKNGDDLRQDMLTLQMIRIMDKLWKQEGLDLRMNPYNCISLEHRVGMIEVVLNAETIANIQKEKGMFSATSAFRKGSLLAWLKDHNRSEAALKKAINEFTLSCAGYCVATYVLGVADRHSDNIMVKTSGQLFHVDFGHILGHFKEKFGFKRERVPFVLTHDFVQVISKGQRNALEFKVFQEYCEKAFMILRKHGTLVMSLCAMMISTGLPELSSEKDLNYLRETLVLSKSDEEALAHFKSKFDEALSNSWKTSVNWATHNLAKNNKA